MMNEIRKITQQLDIGDCLVIWRAHLHGGGHQDHFQGLWRV
jgi:hypothetical protein